MIFRFSRNPLGSSPAAARWCGAIAAALALCWNTASFAQTDEERAGARAAAMEGAKAFNQKRWADSLDLFTRAEKLVHSPMHMLYMARAHAKLGQFVKAREAYMKIVRERLDDNAPAAFRRAKSDAEAELQKIEPKLAHLNVTVKGATEGAEITVTMDGKKVPAALLGLPRPVDPGQHKITASAPGHEDARASVNLAQGKRQAIALTLKPIPGYTPPPAPADGAGEEKATATPATAPAPAPKPSNRDGGSPTLGYVGLGVGVVGIAAGVFFLSERKSKIDEGDELFAQLPSCADRQGDARLVCEVRRESIRGEIGDADDAAASAGTLAAISFGVGGVAAGVGIYLLATAGGDSTDSASAAPGITPWIGYKSIGLSGSF